MKALEYLRHPVRTLAWGISYPQQPGRLDYALAWLAYLVLAAALVVLVSILA